MRRSPTRLPSPTAIPTPPKRLAWHSDTANARVRNTARALDSSSTAEFAGDRPSPGAARRPDAAAVGQQLAERPHRPNDPTSSRRKYHWAARVGIAGPRRRNATPSPANRGSGRRFRRAARHLARWAGGPRGENRVQSAARRTPSPGYSAIVRTTSARLPPPVRSWRTPGYASNARVCLMFSRRMPSSWLPTNTAAGARGSSRTPRGRRAGFRRSARAAVRGITVEDQGRAVPDDPAIRARGPVLAGPNVSRGGTPRCRSEMTTCRRTCG